MVRFFLQKVVIAERWQNAIAEFGCWHYAGIKSLFHLLKINLPIVKNKVKVKSIDSTKARLCIKAQ